VLKAVQKDDYALYIVDEEQLDTDGFELCRELRKLDAHTPILLYCSNVARGKLRLVTQAGAQWCLSKPVDSYCLLSAASWLIHSTAP
jgi:DNA-binding response OmpR family regulator